MSSPTANPSLPSQYVPKVLPAHHQGQEARCLAHLWVAATTGKVLALLSKCLACAFPRAQILLLVTGAFLTLHHITEARRREGSGHESFAFYVLTNEQAKSYTNIISLMPTKYNIHLKARTLRFKTAKRLPTLNDEKAEPGMDQLRCPSHNLALP